MDFYAFRQLSAVAQLYWTLKHGTYLAQRWSEAGGINLYHCADGGRGWKSGTTMGRVLRRYCAAL